MNEKLTISTVNNDTLIYVFYKWLIVMTWLEEICTKDHSLNGLVITQLPNCFTWDSWQKIEFDCEDIAAYFGDMIKAQRNACQTISPVIEDIRLTIETEQFTILAIEISNHFAAIFIFDANIPLGMARLLLKRFRPIILEKLPTENVVERSQGERIMEFVKRYSPDAHTVVMRVSLQTRIPLDILENPATLSDEQIKKLERSVKAILGINNINL